MRAYPVKPYRPRSHTLVFPLRSWLTGASAVLLLAGAVTLVVLSQRGHPMAGQLRRSVNDGMMPVISLLSRPADALDAFGTRIKELMYLDEENRMLRDQNAALLHWQTVARRLQTENETLRRLLDVKPTPEHRFVTARVVTGNPSVFSHTLLVNEGEEEGIRNDQAIITDEGLVGRVIETGQRSAQILLITDLNSRIPVEIEQSGEKALLMGDNTAQPVLRFANEDAAPVKGQRIVTAGDGGVFPAGFAVGEIVSVGKNDVRIQPYVNASRLGFVRAVSPK